MRTPDKLILRQKKSALGISGPHMEIFEASGVSSHGEVSSLGSMNVRPGNSLTLGAGQTAHFVMEMLPSLNGASSRALSYARFPKSSVDGSFEMQYQSRPVVEVYSCGADYETLSSTATPPQNSLFVMRVNDWNGSRRIELRFRLKVLREALKERCPKEEALRYRMGEHCDEMTVGRFFAIPKELRSEVKTPEGVTPEQSLFALTLLGKKSPIKFVSFSNETEYVIQSPPPSQPSSEGSGAANEGEEGVPFELWFAYFLRFEKHVETYNSTLQNGAGELAGEAAGLLPGGTLVAKGAEFAASQVLDLIFSPEQP